MTWSLRISALSSTNTTWRWTSSSAATRSQGEVVLAREGVSLASPFGPVAIGWEQVREAMERAASNYRDGRATGFETLATYVTPDLAYLVEVEHFEAKIGGGEDFASGALRVTSVLRPEDGVWKIAHRHADPITTPRTAESVTQR